MWGANKDNQLGDLESGSGNYPTAIMSIDGAESISAGYGHALVLKNDGTVAAWGNDGSGQLGRGTRLRVTEPMLIDDSINNDINKPWTGDDISIGVRATQAVEYAGDIDWYKFICPYDTVCSFDITAGYIIELYSADEKQLGYFGESVKKDMKRGESIYVKVTKADGGAGEYELSVNGGGIEECRRAQLVTINGSSYFSDLYNEGRLYRNDIPLTSYPVRSICSNGSTVFFAGLNEISRVDGSIITELHTSIKADFLTADEDNIYFSDWNRGGRLYALRLSDNRIIPVCNDVGTHLYIEGSYLYYYNALDNGELYKILRTSRYADSGQKN